MNKPLIGAELAEAEEAFRQYMGGGASSRKWYLIKLSAWLDGAAWMKDRLGELNGKTNTHRHSAKS